jgi:hypothetical protein
MEAILTENVNQKLLLLLGDRGRGLETSVTLARNGIIATMLILDESSLKNILSDTYFLVHEYDQKDCKKLTAIMYFVLKN